MFTDDSNSCGKRDIACPPIVETLMGEVGFLKVDARRSGDGRVDSTLDWARCELGFSRVAYGGICTYSSVAIVRNDNRVARPLVWAARQAGLGQGANESWRVIRMQMKSFGRMTNL